MWCQQLFDVCVFINLSRGGAGVCSVSVLLGLEVVAPLWLLPFDLLSMLSLPHLLLFLSSPSLLSLLLLCELGCR